MLTESKEFTVVLQIGDGYVELQRQYNWELESLSEHLLTDR